MKTIANLFFILIFMLTLYKVRSLNKDVKFYKELYHEAEKDYRQTSLSLKKCYSKLADTTYERWECQHQLYDLRKWIQDKSCRVKGKK